MVGTRFHCRVTPGRKTANQGKGKTTLTNVPEDGEIVDHELHRGLDGVELEQVDGGLLDEVGLGVLGDELVGAEDVADVVAARQPDPLRQVCEIVREAALADEGSLAIIEKERVGFGRFFFVKTRLEASR